MRRIGSKRPTRSEQRCYLCLRNKTSSMCPERTPARMVQPGGFEPPTFGATIRRSNLLSYGCTGWKRSDPIKKTSPFQGETAGPPARPAGIAGRAAGLRAPHAQNPGTRVARRVPSINGATRPRSRSWTSACGQSPSSASRRVAPWAVFSAVSPSLRECSPSAFICALI